MTFTFGNQTIQGEAAEYYQACAHELFSKTPYFRCCNHVCSLTPDQPAVLPAGAVGATDEDGSRGLGFMAADAPPSGLGGTQPHESPVAAASTQSTKNAGLLIDIDSPTPETTGNAAHAKEVQVDSPVSNTSIDSWDESVVDKNEKDSAAQASKGAVETTSQPTVAPVPLPLEPMEPVDRHILEPPAPAPVPAAIPMPEPAPAPAPQIITNIAPPTTTVNVASPPQQQPIQPAVQYMPVFPPAGQPTQAMPMEQPPQPPQEFSRGLSPVAQPAPRVASSQSEWPWGDRAQQQEQTQAQQPSNQGQVTGFEWAYSQPEQTQESSITSEPPVPQSAHTQGHKLARKPVFGHADQPQGPLVIQGRQSGSGWPFGIHAHPHSNAPPVPPVSQPASTGVEAESQQEQPGSEQAQAERGVPQGSGLSPPQGHSSASEPISPGFQRAAGGPGSMQMSDMQAPAPAYTQFFREAPLPPRYDIQPRYDYDPAAGASSVNPSGAMGPNETRRRRLEREEAVGRRVCGLWRGRGPFSKKSGRPGREGRTRRRWYFVICIFFFIIVIVATVLAITLTRKGHSTPIQSRWLNLTGYPPMPTGIATLGGTQPQLEKSTCITPASMWSCALPKDQQNDNEPYNANQPNFRISIQFRNGTYDNSTTVDSKSARLRVRDDMFKPSPAAPSDMDQSFLGQYTDNNTAPYAGEGTPFYMSILSPVSLSTANIYRRSLHSNSTAYPNISSIIPAPDENADGTPAAALLYPLPTSQPIRLYNRGLATEHYGFYTYFDKSIFLSSQTKSQKADTNGGTSKSTAEYRCTWSQTRFLVQIWTQPDTLGRHLLPTNNATATSTTTPTSTSTPIPSSATDFSRPGSFPYPVTITLDRHGGAEKKKMVYCYPISDGHYNITAAQLQLEDREVGGALVNPASGLFKGFSGTKNGSGEEYGGVDGGAGGCGCQWVNWISSS